MEKETVIQDNPAIGCDLRRLDIFADKTYRLEHFHDEVEIVYVESGRILCFVEGEKTILEEGCGVIIASRVIHKLMYFDTVSRISYLRIDIGRYLTTLFPEATLFSCFPNTDLKKYKVFDLSSDVKAVFCNICKELDCREKHYDLAVKGCVYNLLAVMCREGMLNTGSEIMHSKDFEKIAPALIYATENFNKKITLENISEYIKIDKYNFCKQFKKITGNTFFDYLGYLRLKKAEELLIYTGKSITEIALECGFSSVQYFNRVFSQHKKHSPTAFRRMSGRGSNFNTYL